MEEGIIQEHCMSEKNIIIYFFQIYLHSSSSSKLVFFTFWSTAEILQDVFIYIYFAQGGLQIIRSPTANQIYKIKM